MKAVFQIAAYVLKVYAQITSAIGLKNQKAACFENNHLQAAFYFLSDQYEINAKVFE